MKIMTLYSVIALISMLVTSTATWAGGKHGGAGIMLPSTHLTASPWLLMGAAALVGIIAFRLLRSARG